MKKVGAYIGIFIGLAGVCTVDVSAQVNKLHRLFHHRAADNGPMIELGKVVLYLSSNPIVKQVPSAARNERIFKIEQIYVDKAIESEIKRFNAIKTKHYQARLEKDRGGLLLRLSFAHPERVGLEWGTFDAIKGEAGLEFRLYDSDYLKKLNGNHNTLLKVVSSTKPRIVIDCGHGGTDTGAIGCQRVAEKDVTLGVGLSVARLLKQAGNDVFLTRDTDTTIALDDRTSLANGLHADLLVSIHANAASNTAASGVETFCLPVPAKSSLGCSLAVVDKHIVDQADSFRNRHSLDLAQSIQNNILSIAKKKEVNLVDRHVKRAFSQILAGSCMPSVLIEVGFVTNKKEAAWLASTAGQQVIASGICAGIHQHLDRRLAERTIC